MYLSSHHLLRLFHTDREIKNKGKEIINLENGLYGIVEQYQNIELYETIDFGKPWRSMQMGMMPAKLTHMMINIWLSYVIYHSQLEIENLCIYDPFVGSGTTWMLANHFGYDFIGSDIKSNYAEENATRRKTTKFYTPDKQFDIFTHDITQKLKTSVIGEETKERLLIVTEWRLWPIVTKTTSSQDIQRFQEQVVQLYTSFIDRIKELWALAVFTIPYYAGEHNTVEKYISDYATKIGLQTNNIPEIYGREWQQVGRKIMIIKSMNK